MHDDAGPDRDPTVITQVRPPGGPVQDVLVRSGRVQQIAPTGQLPVPAGARIVAGGGRVIVPGLWDEHTHMVQWALGRQRLDLSGATSAAGVLGLVAQRVGEGGDGPIVGYGFRDALWPDQPSRSALDAVSADRPVVLVSGDLHCGWLNTAGAQLLHARPSADGLVREGDWFRAAAHLDDLTITQGEDALRAALPALPARGVVGVVDLEMTDTLGDWSARIGAGYRDLRVEAGIYPDRLDAAIAAGRRTGAIVPGSQGLVQVGPLKILSDGSLNTRTAYCRHQYTSAPAAGTGDGAGAGGYGHLEFSAEQMVDLATRARRAGIAATIHAIGDLAVSTALDVFEQVGVGGRIEHAQLISTPDLDRFAALDVVASVQPEHAMDDRDLADQFWADRTARAFPLAALHRAGATLRLGSDAPVAPLDPWVSMAAAVGRARDGRPAWHPEQRLDPLVALAASTRGRERVAAGDVADLVLIEQDPLTAGPQALRTMKVSATMLAGRWTYGPH